MKEISIFDVDQIKNQGLSKRFKTSSGDMEVDKENMNPQRNVLNSQIRDFNSVIDQDANMFQINTC